jgi:hypothetical protein
MPTPLQYILEKTLSAQQSWKIQLLSKWPHIIGNLKDKVHIEQVTDDTVILGVYDSCWMHELYMLSNMLIKLINQQLDQPRIKKVRFKKSQKKNFVPQEQMLPECIVTTRPLTPAEDQALTNITDPQLRKALEQFLMRCNQER